MTEITPLEGLPEVLLIHPRRFSDHRGYFCETYNAGLLAAHGADLTFVQDNLSYSVAAGTIRGLHFQAPPHAQVKLVRCARGRIFDVVVDFRTGSPTFGKWSGVELSSDSGGQILVPEGFLHGFITLEPACEVQYKVSRHYVAESDGSIAWNDPDIGIVWPIVGEPVLSEKDAKAPRVRDTPSPFRYQAP